MSTIARDPGQAVATCLEHVPPRAPTICKRQSYMRSSPHWAVDNPARVAGVNTTRTPPFTGHRRLPLTSWRMARLYQKSMQRVGNWVVGCLLAVARFDPVNYVLSPVIMVH
eukprot:1415412-Pleurochrysis_carterae.AAC.1